MSGGHFDYEHHRMKDIIESIKFEIVNNYNEYEPYIGHFYDEKTIFKFKQLVKKLQKAYDLTHAVDLLLSNDTLEDDFNEVWEEIMAHDSVCLDNGERL